MNPRRDSEGGVGRLPTPSPPANCIDPSKISPHKLTHRKLILATPYSAVTAEAAGSSPVVPAIPSEALGLILAKPSRTQKGTLLCAFLCPFSPGQFPSSMVLTLQRHPIQTVVTLRSLRTKTP